MKRNVLSVLAVLVLPVMLFVAGVYAQTPQALSELEKVRIENLNLKNQLANTLKAQAETAAQLGACQAQINTGVIRQDAASLKADLEGARPGWTWDFDKQQFVKKGEEKKDPK